MSQAPPWHCPTESQGSERISGDHLIQPPLLKQVPYPGMHPMTPSCACPPHCSLTYPTPAQLTSKDVLGDSIKALLKSRYTTPTALPFTSSHGITEGYQIGQTLFSLGESVLTTPDILLLFHLLGDDIQSKLLHHLSRMELRLTGLSLPSSSFLKTGVTVAFLQPSGTSSDLHDLSKMMESSSASTSAGSLSTHRCILSRPMNLCTLGFHR